LQIFNDHRWRLDGGLKIEYKTPEDADRDRFIHWLYARDCTVHKVDRERHTQGRLDDWMYRKGLYEEAEEGADLLTPQWPNLGSTCSVFSPSAAGFAGHRIDQVILGTPLISSKHREIMQDRYGQRPSDNDI